MLKHWILRQVFYIQISLSRTCTCLDWDLGSPIGMAENAFRRGLAYPRGQDVSISNLV